MMAWLRFSAFFQMMALSLANLIPLFWSKSLGYNPEQIGFIIGVANFVAIVAPLFFGSFGGIRPVFWILICFGGMILSAFFMSFFSIYATQLFLFSVFIFLRSGILTLVPLGVMHQIKENPGAEYARYRRIGSIGFLVGSVGIGFAMDKISVNALFWVLASACLFAILPYFLKIKIPAIPPSEHIFTRYASVFTHNKLKWFWPATFFINSWSVVVFSFMPLRISELGYSSTFASVVQSLCGVTALLTLSWIGRLVDRHSMTKLYMLVPIFAFIRIFAMSLPDTHAEWFLLIQLLHIPTWVLGEVIQVNFLKEHAPQELRPESQAIYQVISALSLAVCGAIGGIFAHRLNMPTAFQILAFVPFLAFPFLYKLKRAMA
jgi:predicted MFS family arabinose efflux permease